MGRRKFKQTDFPLLARLGLKATDIIGDGNCMFRAMSDQLYGNQSGNKEIRGSCVQYIRARPNEYKYFIHVNTGGGQRRNPKRKNVAVSAANQVGPTEQEIDNNFETYITNMAKPGVYGDNLEIMAFAKHFKCNVRVFSKEGDVTIWGEEDNTELPMIYLARHDWEHYSSVRNIDDNSKDVKPVVTPLDAEDKAAAVKANRAEPTSNTKKVQDWMVKSVGTSIPYFVDEVTITKALQENGCNVDNTVSQLLEEPSSTPSSIPSTPSTIPSQSSQSGSFSIARDIDTDDEEGIQGPCKRPYRKMKEAEKSRKEAEEKELANIPNLDLKEEGVSMKKLFI